MSGSCSVTEDWREPEVMTEITLWEFMFCLKSRDGALEVT